MNPILRVTRRGARRRELAIVSGFALPWLALAVWLSRALDHPVTCVALVVALLASLITMIVRWRHWGPDALRRALNHQHPELEDSSDLLLRAPSAPNALQALQIERLEARLAAQPPQLARPWPLRTLGISALLALAAFATIHVWPAATPATAELVSGDTTGSPPPPAQLLAAGIRITPPAYTGLPERAEATLSIQAPQGSQLAWELQFAPEPERVALVGLDGQRIELEHHDGAWRGSLQLETSLLYRLEVDGALREAQAPFRLDALIDQPPRLRVLQPEASLSRMQPGQRGWALRFEAEDDYGLDPRASLHLTLAQGTGELIAVREWQQGLRGEGEAQRLQFSTRIDLAALALDPGDEVIAQLRVRDQREPQAQESRSPSLILRWPARPEAPGSGTEGIVQRVMPAWFRSQRQIIIDAEALLANRPGLSDERFAQHSDALGVDQRLLRLRYGQFLGEEADGAPSAAGADDGHAHEIGLAELDSTDSLLQAFGHVHDNPEAATLLDPQTRALLKQALDQMWQSELRLRQATPDQALPHAYRALDFIKQVQQADRIYLARVGPDLPPIDPARRLTGERTQLAAARDFLPPAAAPSDAPVTALWQALAALPEQQDDPVRMDDFSRWLREHAAELDDPLSLQAALDVVQRRPDCDACRVELRALLWPLLRTPAAHPARRPQPDEQGARYLDALEDAS